MKHLRLALLLAMTLCLFILAPAVWAEDPMYAAVTERHDLFIIADVQISGDFSPVDAQEFVGVRFSGDVRIGQGVDRAFAIRTDNVSIPWPKGLTFEEALLAWRGNACAQ